MYLTKKRLYISMIVIILVTIAIVLFVQPMQLNNATEEMVETLNEQYDEKFDVMWSDIGEKTVKTFLATVKSQSTGYVYDVSVEKGEPSIDYDTVNAQMALNEQIESDLPGVFAMMTDESTVLLTTSAISKEQLVPLKDLVGETVTVLQLDEKSYQVATEHIDDFYQRSTMPTTELDQYNPTTTTITLTNP